MKVLWINHFVPYPAKGGLLIRTSNLLSACAKDHDIDLIALIQPRLMLSYFPSLEIGINSARTELNKIVTQFHTTELKSERSKIQRLFTLIKSITGNTAYSVNWLESNEAREKISELIQRNQYDLIHVDTSSLLTMLPKDLKIQVIVNHHNAEHHMMLRRAEKENNILKKLIFIDEARKIRKFDKNHLAKEIHNIACSEDDKKRIEELGVNSKKISVIPNSVKIPFDMLRTPDQNKLLFVGGLNWYPNQKGVEWFLVEIWPALSKQFKSLTFDIIGKSPSKRTLQLVSDSERVSLHGYVEDISTFYQNTLAFISPIFDGGGTKLKVLDAMANGIPVIGNDLAFEGIEVTDNHNALIANDNQSYIKAISLLISEKNINTIGSNAKKLIGIKYDASKVGKKYSNLIRELGKVTK